MGIDLRDIVHQHGGDLYAGGRAAVIPGPGHSRRDRSLSLMLSEAGDRVIFHSHAGDDAKVVMAYLGVETGRSDSRTSREEWERLRRIREREQRRLDAEDRAICDGIWNATVAIDDTPAEAYLYRRGLVLDYAADVRFHPAAPRTKRPALDGDGPPPCAAMVAMVRGVDCRPSGLHLTYLTPDGRKAFAERSRLMFGKTGGAAVQLMPVGRGGVLAVGEGIETSAAYALLKGRAAWAALSTSGLLGFQVPPGVRRLYIAADMDDKGAGLKAATDLAQRACRVCDVEIDPAPDGQDWGNVLEAQHG